jgi:hypothetical protein
VNAESSPPSSEQEAVCYLCLDAEPDEDDELLLRPGFVHLACLADYAAVKSKQTISMNKFASIAVKSTGTSLELISQPSLCRSFEGNIQSSLFEATCTQF